MPPVKLEILYEDNHILAVSKPTGLPTQGALRGMPSAASLAQEYLKRKYHKPGNAFIGVVSRLDALVTGVVVLARTSKAAARLTRQFGERSVEKTYWAIVEGRLEPAAGECDDWLAKDDLAQKMRAVGAGFSGAQRARLAFRRLELLASGDSLVEIGLETGRKHQIRVQMAACGHPIVGDVKYGSRRQFSAGIALHARAIKFVHPVRQEPIVLTAPVPAAWRKLLGERSLD